MLIHLLAEDFYDGTPSLWRLQFFNNGRMFARFDNLPGPRNKCSSYFVGILACERYIYRGHDSIFLSID